MLIKLGLLITMIMWTPLVQNSYAKDMLVGVESLEYLPFYSGKGRAGYNGFAREVFDKFSKDSGHNINYVPKNVTNLFKLYKSGKFDFKFPDNALWKTDEKKGLNITYSSLVVKTKMGVICLKKNKSEPLNKVGVVDGFTPWAILGDVKTGKIVLVKKNRMLQLLKLLINNEIDGVYGSIDVFNHHANKLKKVGEFEFNTNIKTSVDEFYFSSINNPEIIKQFSSWLKTNSSYITDMKKQYGIGE